MIVLIKNREHFSEVTAHGLVLVDFYTNSCMPCKMYAAELERVNYDLPFVTIAKVCGDDNEDILDEFDVTAVPTTLIFQDGRQKHRYTGGQKRPDVERLLAEYLYE